MLNAVRAEWQKISANRITAIVFVWSFPATAFMLLVFAAIAALISETFRSGIFAQPPRWTDQLLFPWILINSEIARFVMVIFAADVFGGEYQRMMWKNLLIRSSRTTLILSKFFTMALFMISAFVLMCIIIVIGVGVIAALVGAPYLPALSDFSAAARDQFLRQLGAQALIAFAAALIASAYAALGGIFTRSILGAVIVGGLLTFAEQAIVLVLVLLGSILEMPQIVQLYKVTPGYNLANLSSWANFGTSYTPLYMAQYGTSDFSVGLSTVITLLWLGGLIGLVLYLFRRQDIMA